MFAAMPALMPPTPIHLEPRRRKVRTVSTDLYCETESDDDVSNTRSSDVALDKYFTNSVQFWKCITNDTLSTVGPYTCGVH